MSTLPLIGLVGGTTWLSTLDYYRYLNEGVARRRGALQSARLLLHSVNFGELIEKESAGDILGEQRILLDAVHSLQEGGATLMAFCANTAHVHLTDIEPKCAIPVISIVDAIAEALLHGGYERAGILCTHRTRTSGIFASPLARKAKCDLLFPSDEEQRNLDELIRNGATAGRYDQYHAASLSSQILRMQERGASVVVLACTELPLVLGTTASPLPVLDSTRVHVEAILDAAGV